MEIRDATVDDAVEIIELQKRAFLSEAEMYGDYSIPPLTQSLDDLISGFGRRTTLKAVRDGRIIGSVNGCMDGETCLIGRLMVHPDHRKRGIATRLMEAVEHRFGSARTWELFTGELSRDNIRLYQRLGYVITARQPLPEGRFALVYMRKTRP